MFRCYKLECVAYDEKNKNNRLCDFKARQIEAKVISSNIADGYIADLGNRYVVATDNATVKDLVKTKKIKPRNTLVFVDGEQFRVMEIRFRNNDLPFIERWQRNAHDEVEFVLE